MDRILKDFGVDTEFIYQAFSACSDNYIYVFDIESDTLLISKKMVEDFHLKGEIIEGFKNKWMHGIHARDYKRVCALQEQIFDGKADTINIEYKFIKDTLNEEYVWLRNQGIVRRDTNTNEVKTIIGVLHNMAFDDDIDSVTGLLTHEKCQEHYQEIQKEQEDASGIIILIGFDEFGTINTLNNHEFGDLVLRTTVKEFLKMIPREGYIFRFDGDQFAIFVQDTTKQKMYEIFREIQVYTNTAHMCDGISYRFTVSGGMVSFPEDGKEWMEIEKSMSIALKKAKTLGKNRCIEFNREMLSEEIWEQELNNHMANSIENNFAGFVTLYQPVCITDTLSVKGAEVLLRFFTPNGKLISPVEFIPILESSQMIIPVGLWVLEQAIQTCKKWLVYNPDFVMNVNVSYVQLRDHKFCKHIEELLKKHQLDTKHIVLELTESCFISDAAYIKQTLACLHDLHLMIAMDDFGTGYSSLARLSQFNVDVIKIDRAFVQSLHEKKYNSDFIDAVVRLCHDIGMKVCVEGVETADEQKTICALNADYVQGFYVSKPIDEGTFFDTFITQLNINDILVVKPDRQLRHRQIIGDKDVLTALMDATPLASVFWNREYEIVASNEEVLRLFGVSSLDEHRQIFFAFSPTLQAGGKRSIDKAKELIDCAFKGEPVCVLWTHCDENGEAIPCEVTFTRIPFLNDYLVVSYTRDMRKQFAMEQTISTFNSRLQALLDATPLCLNLWNHNFQNVMCNQVAVNLFDLKDKKEYMERFFELSPVFQPDGSKSTDKAIQKITDAFENDRTHFSWIHQNLLGEQIPCEITLVKIEGADDDNEPMIAGYTKDIREEIEATKAERRASQRITAVLNSMPLASILWSVDQVVIDSNEVAVKLFKAKNQADLNTCFYDLFPEKQPDGSGSVEKYILKFKEAINDEKCVFEWMYRSFDGEEIPCEVTLVRLNLEGEDIVVAYSRDLRELHQTLELNSKLTEIAYIDMLTGTATRARFMENLEVKFEQGKELERFALMVFDIDYFKSINDNYGHGAGDEALKTITHKISSLLPEKALLGRFGGDEFMVQIDAIDKEELYTLMERLTKAISATKFYHEGHSFTTSISIGATYKLPSDEDYNSLLKRADKAMYKAKNRGRNCCIIL